MEPTGFRLLTQSVIFNSSHVKGGGEGSGGKVAVHGGVEVTGNHGMGTRFFRVLGNDELEPSSRRPPRGGGLGSTRFSFVCAVGSVELDGAPPRAPDGQGYTWLISSWLRTIPVSGTVISSPRSDCWIALRLSFRAEGIADANIVWLRTPRGRPLGFIVKRAVLCSLPRIDWDTYPLVIREAGIADANIVWLRTPRGRPLGFIVKRAVLCSLPRIDWDTYPLVIREVGIADANIVWLRTLWGKPQRLRWYNDSNRGLRRRVATSKTIDNLERSSNELQVDYPPRLGGYSRTRSPPRTGKAPEGWACIGTIGAEPRSDVRRTPVFRSRRVPAGRVRLGTPGVDQLTGRGRRGGDTCARNAVPTTPSGNTVIINSVKGESTFTKFVGYVANKLVLDKHRRCKALGADQGRTDGMKGARKGGIRCVHDNLPIKSYFGVGKWKLDAGRKSWAPIMAMATVTKVVIGYRGVYWHRNDRSPPGLGLRSSRGGKSRAGTSWEDQLIEGGRVSWARNAVVAVVAKDVRVKVVKIEGKLFNNKLAGEKEGFCPLGLSRWWNTEYNDPRRGCITLNYSKRLDLGNIRRWGFESPGSARKTYETSGRVRGVSGFVIKRFGARSSLHSKTSALFWFTLVSKTGGPMSARYCQGLQRRKVPGARPGAGCVSVCLLKSYSTAKRRNLGLDKRVYLFVLVKGLAVKLAARYRGVSWRGNDRSSPGLGLRDCGGGRHALSGRASIS